MRGRASILALGAALAAAGCVYSPEGRCEATSDCAAGEQCTGGVCVLASPGGGGFADPQPFTSIVWSSLDAGTGAAFRVASVGADPAGGDVVVAGEVDAAYDLDPVAADTPAAGAFVVRRAGGDGAVVWAEYFPTFSHGALRTAVLPDGDVLFAGAAVDPTTIGTVFAPDARGTLIVGRLDAATGDPVWATSIDNTHATAGLVPAAIAVSGAGDRFFVAGTGSGNFGPGVGPGCGDDTADASFAAALSGEDGSCRWSLGLGTRTLSDAEAIDDGSADGQVAVAGVCTPAAASFDPGGGASCTRGLFLAVLDGADGSTDWATTVDGDVSAVHDLAIAPGGRATLVADASGALDPGAGSVNLGDTPRSFAATWDPTAASTAAVSVVRPVESPPDAAERDELALSRCAYDAAGRLWLAGRYLGQPALGGIRFTACRAPACGAAAFLAELDATGGVASFLPIRVAPGADGGAHVDDLALFATTGTVAAAVRLTGAPLPGGPGWQAASAGLGVLRAEP